MYYIGTSTFECLNYLFKTYELDYDVISCVEAAEAKGIEIKNELKTLVLETSSGICTVSVSAKNHVSLRQIKKNNMKIILSYQRLIKERRSYYEPFF